MLLLFFEFNGQDLCRYFQQIQLSVCLPNWKLLEENNDVIFVEWLVNLSELNKYGGSAFTVLDG